VAAQPRIFEGKSVKKEEEAEKILGEMHLKFWHPSLISGGHYTEVERDPREERALNNGYDDSRFH